VAGTTLLVVVSGILGTPVAAGLIWLWVAPEWEEPQDVETTEWERSKDVILHWRLARWLQRRPRQLTYGRDRRGRFRRVRRG
jgi:hypothetical protein